MCFLHSSWNSSHGHSPQSKFLLIRFVYSLLTSLKGPNWKQNRYPTLVFSVSGKKLIYFISPLILKFLSIFPFPLYRLLHLPSVSTLSSSFLPLLAFLPLRPLAVTYNEIVSLSAECGRMPLALPCYVWGFSLRPMPWYPLTIVKLPSHSEEKVESE